MRVQLFGDAAVLASFDTADANALQQQSPGATVLDCVLRAKAALEQGGLPAGVRELIPAADTLTVMLDTESPAARQSDVAKLVRELDLHAQEHATADSKLVTIEVRYDGEDLQAVAAHFGVQPAEVVEWHQAMRWRAAFGGFAPGFVYLVPQGLQRPCSAAIDVDATPVPRLDSPRTAIPAGAVALAGSFSAVYPQASPGGWQLIGSTSSRMFDLDRATPSLIQPGDSVAFVSTAPEVQP